MNARQSSRLLSLVLFAALCALLTHWVLTLSSLRSLGAPREARVAQTDALETGAAVTLFGGGPQNGPRDVQVMGVVADLADGSGAAIVSVDGGAPQAVRAGKSLSSNIKLVEIKARSVVIERNGARQEIPLPASALGGGGAGQSQCTGDAAAACRRRSSAIDARHATSAAGCQQSGQYLHAGRHAAHCTSADQHG